MSDPQSPEQLFAAVLEDRPAQPVVTYYDGATGERIELSAKSLGNWVAKTHFLLSDVLGLGVRNVAFVDVPAHWISVPVLLGCWTAGLEVVTTPVRADVGFVGPDSADRAAKLSDVYAVAPESAATGYPASPPKGAQDYVRAVRPQPDAWSTVHPPARQTDSALDGASRSEIAARARARAAELGLGQAARVLSNRSWSSGNDWIDVLLAPLAVCGSLVILRNGPPEALERIKNQERITSQI